MDDEPRPETIDEDLDDEPEILPSLREAAERLLAQSRAGGRALRWTTTDQERLTRVLELLGQLNEQRHHAAGFLGEDDEPADEGERRYQAERDRAFNVHCADHLVEIAAAALEFAVELTASFADDKPARQARNDAIDELRTEPPRPRRARACAAQTRGVLVPRNDRPAISSAATWRLPPTSSPTTGSQVRRR